MNLKNTYFGFTNNKKPMQVAKIKNTLDKLWRFDGEVMSMKEYVFIKLQEGSKPNFEENYSYYSRRLDDYTKPKTLYKIQHDDNTYTEVTKTAYNYALHLINNDLLNEEKAQLFIDNEKVEKEQKERLEQERAQKEREETEAKRQKEEQEHKERRERKQREWHLIGEKILDKFEVNPITSILDNHWEKIKSIYVDEEKESFYNAMHEKFTIMLGNQDYCIHYLQMYVENENDTDQNKREYTIEGYPTMKLEKDILFKVFDNVSMDDKNITITAKVKAVFEDREYKGSNNTSSNNVQKFYWLKNDNGQHNFVESHGKKLNIEGIKAYLKYNEDNTYSIVEEQTGLNIATNKATQREAKDVASKAVSMNKEKLETLIQNAIKRYGLSPLYKEQETV